VIPRPNDRIRLDTSVLDTLFHSPAVLARRLAKLDQLSGGRRLIGFGPGVDDAGVHRGRHPAGAPRRRLRRRARHGLMTQRLRQKGVGPGSANGFHPQVHFRVTPPDPTSPSLLASQLPTSVGRGLGKVSVTGTRRAGVAA
jgi:alkanesulfonate monooxygenase SsuD/methylene tetrahydromethanopterin reductase-like flavin-dependent oxidoreductase (luciferase family)